MLPILFFVVLSVSLAWFLESQATTTIIFVKHADTELSLEENSDPSLSILGIERSILLANTLQDIDVIASVDEIYVDETARTIQTAEPLASRLDISPISRNPYEVDDFMREILSQHKGKIILVVTHSDIISDLIVELHGSKNIPIIERDEFDNIYIVTDNGFFVIIDLFPFADNDSLSINSASFQDIGLWLPELVFLYNGPEILSG